LVAALSNNAIDLFLKVIIPRLIVTCDALSINADIVHCFEGIGTLSRALAIESTPAGSLAREVYRAIIIAAATAATATTASAATQNFNNRITITHIWHFSASKTRIRSHSLRMGIEAGIVIDAVAILTIILQPPPTTSILANTCKPPLWRTIIN